MYIAQFHAGIALSRLYISIFIRSRLKVMPLHNTGYGDRTRKPSSLKGNARQQCMYEGPLRTNIKSVKKLYFSAQGHSRSLLSVSIETRV